MGRGSYLGLATAAFLAQHAFVFTVASLLGRPVSTGPEFWYLPFRQYAQIPELSNVLMAAGLLVALASAAAMALLSFRRTAAAGRWWALTPFTIIPLAQMFAILALAILPSQGKTSSAEGPDAPDGAGWLITTQGVLAGMTIIVFAVAVGALVFGVYGWGVFVLAPLLVGFTTAYIGNRRYVVSRSRTFGWVCGACVLGGFMLVLFSLEGGLCLIMAFPLAIVLALAGAELGRKTAEIGRRASPALLSLAVLPTVFGAEAMQPPAANFDTVQSVVSDAPPSAVWSALISEASITGPLPLPLRLGLAYPLRAEINGEGVGALRLGVFSTGIAEERITAWEENRRLAFKVLKDPPSMRELSPYRQVHAPHLEGYFRTASTSFELEPLAGGRTRIVERTTHELRLDPALYWLPMAKWVVRQNNSRVLHHLKALSETTARLG